MSKPDAAARRFVIVQTVLAIALAAAMLGAVAALERVDAAAMRWLISAIPIAILLVWTWAFVGFVRASDEMMRELQIRSLAISGAVVIVPATLWGILERFVGVPEFPLFLIGPAFALVHGVVWTRVHAAQ